MNAKIYKIVDVGYEKCYVGSTCEELSQRMARHRQKYYFNEKHVQKKHSNSRVLFDEYGVENCKIELIETTRVIVKSNYLDEKVIISKI